MKYRNLYLLTICLLQAIAVHAQKLTVERMMASSVDLSASQYERKDLTSQACGLVKVQLAALGAQFEGNVIPPAEYKTGEYWVYMSPGSYMLSIKHPQFVPLMVNFRDYGIQEIMSKTTYVLTLVMPQIGQVVDDGIRYLVLNVEPKNSTVYINDEQCEVKDDGTVRVQVNKGVHNYRVSAAGYTPEVGRVEVGDSKVTKTVVLKSEKATLSISCSTSGAQVYIDEELKGTLPWSGLLTAGSHSVEARLSSHRSNKQSVTLGKRETRQLEIPALIPITSSLNVDYQPTDAEVWLDGKRLGASPDIFRGILVGQHQLEIRKNGYQTKKETVEVKEGETTQLSGSLTKEQSSSVSASVSGNSIETITVKGVSFNMVRVEGGTFQMGATSEQGSDASRDEKPVHQVTLSTYYIGETEVTQELWETVMGSNPSKYKGAKMPVELVYWDDCQAFVQKLKQLTGRNFRLPTEAEWEYAARGGNKSRGYKYAGSNNLKDVAWYEETTNGPGTRDVKMKQANELGLYDMSGNVYEWCQDLYGSYSSGSQTNPTGASSGSLRVARGGSWGSSASCRVSDRFNSLPGSTFSCLGLRLAL